MKLVPDVDVAPDELRELEADGYMAMEARGTYRLLDPEQARKAVAKELQLHFLGVPVSWLVALLLASGLFYIVCGS